jgi:hypothetical protein
LAVRWAAALVLAAALATSVEAAPPPIKATPQPPLKEGSATAVASPATSGERPVALTLKLRYEMTCGQPGVGPVVVVLPATMMAPATIARKAVLVRGRAAPSVNVKGHVITIGLPRPPLVICQSIGLGTLTVTFTRAARLGNPMAPGVYTVHARVGGRTFTAALTVVRQA